LFWPASRWARPNASHSGAACSHCTASRTHRLKIASSPTYSPCSRRVPDYDGLGLDIPVSPPLGNWDISSHGRASVRHLGAQHDRNRRGYAPGSNSSHRIGHDDIDVQTDRLGRKCGKPNQVCVGITKLDVQVPTLDIAEIAQRIPKCCAVPVTTVEGSGLLAEIADPRDLIWLLRARRERPCCRAAKQTD
jgi:hypothetical protein